MAGDFYQIRGNRLLCCVNIFFTFCKRLKKLFIYFAVVSVYAVLIIQMIWTSLAIHLLVWVMVHSEMSEIVYFPNPQLC